MATIYARYDNKGVFQGITVATIDNITKKEHKYDRATTTIPEQKIGKVAVYNEETKRWSHVDVPTPTPLPQPETTSDAN